MLVLSRKTHERIKIGDDVWVSVEQIQGRQVKIGIEAPKEVVVLREEVELLSKTEQFDDIE